MKVRADGKPLVAPHGAKDARLRSPCRWTTPAVPPRRLPSTPPDVTAMHDDEPDPLRSLGRFHHQEPGFHVVAEGVRADVGCQSAEKNWMR